ncbi:hypothetical protein F5Y19DRAFT_480531 [Xylariaceae sp. FL1651]|nr:hypothetical protein F5Y19DRAFT_480531 [Xylariaceae sp. FL1651]
MPPISPSTGSTVLRNAQPPRRGLRQQRYHSYHHKQFRYSSRHNSASSRNTLPYKDTFGVDTKPWQSTEALELSLHPRSFEELHSERVYLLDALQWRDRRALELFRRVPVVEEQINRCQNQDQQHTNLCGAYISPNGRVKVTVQADGIPSEHKSDPEWEVELRKARRNQVWLRRQIEATVSAERNLLIRLGELHVEIQCRERWCQVEKEREEFLRASKLGDEVYRQPQYEQRQHGYHHQHYSYPNFHPYSYSYLYPHPQPHQAGYDGLNTTAEDEQDPLPSNLPGYLPSSSLVGCTWAPCVYCEPGECGNENEAMWRPAPNEAVEGSEQDQPPAMRSMNEYNNSAERDGQGQVWKTVGRPTSENLSEPSLKHWPSVSEKNSDVKLQRRRRSFPSVG